MPSPPASSARSSAAQLLVLVEAVEPVPSRILSAPFLPASSWSSPLWAACLSVPFQFLFSLCVPLSLMFPSSHRAPCFSPSPPRKACPPPTRLSSSVPSPQSACPAPSRSELSSPSLSVFELVLLLCTKCLHISISLLTRLLRFQVHWTPIVWCLRWRLSPHPFWREMTPTSLNDATEPHFLEDSVHSKQPPPRPLLEASLLCCWQPSNLRVLVSVCLFLAETAASNEHLA